MSTLEQRALDCLRGYGITHPTLTVDEIASEVMLAMFPEADEYGDNPIWDKLIAESNRCTNCLTRWDDCACCVGCGATDADLIGSHGYWCAL